MKSRLTHVQFYGKFNLIPHVMMHKLLKVKPSLVLQVSTDDLIFGPTITSAPQYCTELHESQITHHQFYAYLLKAYHKLQKYTNSGHLHFYLFIVCS